MTPAPPPARSSLGSALVGAAMLAFGLTLFWFQYLRYRTFKAHIHDLGLITQTLWNTLQGDWFRNSINPEIGYSASYLGNHFSPGLVAWLPAFALAPSPVTLLFLQALGLALGAWPLWLLIRDELPTGAALALVATYLLQPALWFAGLYDFHHETVAATLGLWIWWCHKNDRVAPMLLLLAFTASLKENLPLLTGAFGVYLFLSRARPRLGLAIAVASAVTFALAMGVFIPHFNQTESHSYFARRFPHLGHNAREALMTCVTEPGRVLGFMATARHAYYLQGLLGPWCYLPLLNPGLLLVTLPVLFINMQSQIPLTYDIGSYHSDSAVPWIALCAVGAFIGLTRRSRIVKRHATLLAALVLVNAVSWHANTASTFLPDQFLPLSPRAIHADYHLTPHHLAIDHLHDLIPWDASVSCQTNLACFFTDRPALYPFPARARDADYVLLDLTETYGHRADYRKFWLEWERQATIPKYCQAVRDLLVDPDHRVIFAQDGWLLFSRASAGLGASGRHDLPLLSDVRDAVDAHCAVWTGLTGRGYGR